MSLLGLVGVRIIPGNSGSVILPQEVLRIDVGISPPERNSWLVGCELHTANIPSPLIMPRGAIGVARAVNPYELVQNLRMLADAIEKRL